MLAPQRCEVVSKSGAYAYVRIQMPACGEEFAIVSLTELACVTLPCFLTLKNKRHSGQQGGRRGPTALVIPAISGLE